MRAQVGEKIIKYGFPRKKELRSRKMVMVKRNGQSEEGNMRKRVST